jgi:peptide/nickel transport system permease protein
VLTGDLGKSLFTGESVADLIMNRIGPTLILASFSLIVALALGVPLGVISAARPNSWVDRATAILSVSGQAIPNFWFGLVLIVVFSVWLRWTPVSGSETWANFILPVATLGLSVMPQFVRITRNEMLEALGADYIRTARSKGIRPSRVLFRHALRNAALPVVSLAAVTFGFLLGGTVIVESVFGINGLGLMAFEGILSGDFPIVQMVVVMIALAYVALNLLADVINVWLDPRLRAE